MIAFACSLVRPAFRLDARFDGGPGVTALFGPSGAGKSSIIRLIAGLERPTAGRIRLGDTVLTAVGREAGGPLWVPPHRRQIGVVFQDGLLLPHLDVLGNLTYGRFFTPRDTRVIEIDQVVDVLGIGSLLSRKPGSLSGGERQRVAIGRALLRSPRLLLLDEPLASLDQARKDEILPFIVRLRDRFRIPIIYVTHAREEVLMLAEHVVMLRDGQVEAGGAPAALLGPQAPVRHGQGATTVAK